MPKTILCSNIAFLILFSFFSLQNNFAQLVWTTQLSGTIENIESLDFVDANTGWTVSGTNGTSRTTDGENWYYSTIPGANNMFGVDFVSATKGWAVDNYGSVFHTNNAGSTWAMQYSNSNWSGDQALEIFFLDDQHGWVARQGQIVFTDDGGLTWDSSYYSMSWPAYDVEFVTPEVGYIMGLANSISKSTDGGNTWTEKIVDLSGNYYGSFDVVNENVIYVVGQEGLILFSEDGGDTWIQQTSGVGSLTLLDVHFFDLDHGIIVGEGGTILTTVNGGSTWTPNTSGVVDDLRGVKMVSPTEAYAVGYYGNILKTVPQPTDLVIDIYLGDNYACYGDIINVPVTIKNQANAEITNGTFSITNALGDIVLTAPWSGSLLQSEYEDIVIGQIPIGESDYFTIAFTGDSIDNNNTHSFSISVYDHSAVSISGPHLVCPGDSLELKANGGEYYDWLSLTPADTLPSVYITTNEDAFYPVKITYATFCKWIDTIYVSIDNSCNSNNLAFTPNNDGINDYLHLDGVEHYNNTVTIYNRWGSKINFFTNYNNDDVAWQGDDYWGVPLHEGTYYYVIENGGVLIDGAQIGKVGWVQILR